MPIDKVSTRKSGAKKDGQRHKNTTKYKHNKNSKLTRKITAMPISGRLCARCQEIVQWRKDFRKYKPLTVAKKCVSCEEKKIKEAYHILCGDCASQQGVCVKCKNPHQTSEAGEEDAKDPLDQEQLARIQELESPSSASEEDDSS